MKIGKALIAVLMGDAVVKARAHTGQAEGGDWFGYVINKMRNGASTPEEFAKGNSQVKFVTFNFDTIIEDRLLNSLKAIYRDGDVATAMKAVPVIHVHGKLPPVPDVPMQSNQVDAIHVEWLEWVESAASNINVVLEDIDESVLEAARMAVTESKVICFLGFAYDPENLKRLNLPGVLETMKRTPKMFGSAYGLRAGEQASVVTRLLSKIDLGSEESGCLDILRDLHVFRD